MCRVSVSSFQGDTVSPLGLVALPVGEGALLVSGFAAGRIKLKAYTLKPSSGTIN